MGWKVVDCGTDYDFKSTNMRGGKPLCPRVVYGGAQADPWKVGQCSTFDVGRRLQLGFPDRSSRQNAVQQDSTL